MFRRRDWWDVAREGFQIQNHQIMHAVDKTLNRYNFNEVACSYSSHAQNKMNRKFFICQIFSNSTYLGLQYPNVVFCKIKQLKIHEEGDSTCCFWLCVDLFIYFTSLSIKEYNSSSKSLSNGTLSQSKRRVLTDENDELSWRVPDAI